MEVLKTNAWKEGENPEIPKNSFFFGMRDLTSDYYQVMIERERPRWCRMLWCVIILGLLVFTGYIVYLMLSDFLQYGSYDKINTVVTNTSVLLPSIMICSLNSVNYTSLEKDLKETDATAYQEFRDLIKSTYLANDYDYDYALSDYENLIAYEEEHGPLSFSFRNDAWNLISRTSRHDYFLGDVGYNISNWLTETGYNELGSCIELNDDAKLTQTVGGSQYGLTIDLDAGLDTYAPFTKSVGMKVFIKDHDETLFFNQGGIIVNPGTETFIQTYLSKVTRLKPKWGTCVDKISILSKYKGKTMESRRECLQLTRVMEMVNEDDSCGCIPWYVVQRMKDIGREDSLDYILQNLTDTEEQSGRRRRRETDDAGGEDDDEWNWSSGDNNYTDYYDKDELEEMEKYDNYDDYFTQGLNYSKYFCDSVDQAKCNNRFPKFWVDAQAYIASTCKEPCNYNHYDVSVSSTKFPPTEAYFNEFLKDKGGDDIYTWEYAQNNLIRLHVFYDEIAYFTRTQTADYEIQNFIGELGGVVDLFIGFSFFTVFQLLEISIAFVALRWCRRKTADSDSVVEVAPAPDSRGEANGV